MSDFRLVPSCVWLAGLAGSPPGQRRTVARVKTRFVSWNVVAAVAVFIAGLCGSPSGRTLLARQATLFPGPGRGAKPVPPFGVGVTLMATLCARIWKKSRLKSTLRGLSWWQGLPNSICRLILLPWIQTAASGDEKPRANDSSFDGDETAPLPCRARSLSLAGR